MTSSSGLGFSWTFPLTRSNRPYLAPVSPCFVERNEKENPRNQRQVYCSQVIVQASEKVTYGWVPPDLTVLCSTEKVSFVMVGGHSYVQDSAVGEANCRLCTTQKSHSSYFSLGMCSPAHCLLNPDLAHQ